MSSQVAPSVSLEFDSAGPARSLRSLAALCGAIPHRRRSRTDRPGPKVSLTIASAAQLERRLGLAACMN